LRALFMVYDHTPALRAFRQAMARSFGGFDAAVA
jgi:hypothetical protein